MTISKAREIDIISRLDASYLSFIVEQIFIRLDVRSRTMLSQVSKTWQRIFDSIKLDLIMKLREQDQPALFSNLVVLKRVHCSHKTLALDTDLVRCCAMNGQWLSAGCQSGRIRIWNRRTLDLQSNLTSHDQPVTSLFMNDKILIAGHRGGCVISYDITTFIQLQTIRAGDGNIYDNVTVLCNDRHLVTSLRVSTSSTSLRRSLLIYRISDQSIEENSKKIIHFHGHSVSFDQFYLDPHFLVHVYHPTATRGCQLSIRTSSSSYQQVSQVRNFAPEHLSGALTYANGWIVGQSLDQRTVHLWHVETEVHRTIRHAGDVIYSVSCNAIGQILTRSWAVYRLWEVSSSGWQLLCSLRDRDMHEKLHKIDVFDEHQLVNVIRRGPSRQSVIAVLQLEFQRV